MALWSIQGPESSAAVALRWGPGRAGRATEYDVRGATRNGVRAIGVLWGYGSRDELTSAGAQALAEAPGALLRLATEVFG